MFFGHLKRKGTMKAETAERKSTGVKKGSRKYISECLNKFCHMGVYLFLFFFVVVYVFYAPEGYIQMATNKYLFFRSLAVITGAVILPPAVFAWLLSLPGKDTERSAEAVSWTDIFMLLFLLLNCISFFLTKYKEEAFWGTSGWYMGFAMQISFVGIYFMMSRFYDRKINLLPLFMAVTSIVFLWGLLNRFSIYPIDMQYDSVSFISCIGNINWFSGFWSVFFAIGVVLYLVAKKRSLRIISAFYSILALAMGVVEGSDSAFISIGVVFFFLFLISFQKTDYMKRWLDEGIFYCAACQIMRVIAAFGPQDFNQFGELSKESARWGGLNLKGTTVEWMLGNLTLAALIIFIVLRILLEREDRKYREQTGTQKDQQSPQYIWKLRPVKYIVTGLAVTVAAVYLTLLIINTRTPGILGPLSKYPFLLFDGHWGSNRGTTWRDGLAIYQTFSLRERLFGAGPDCFAAYAYSVPELAARLAEHWPTSRLTNAHNECITFLVNLGIFGMLSFIGIFFSSFRRLLMKAEEEPVCCVYAAVLLSYFFHNQFSFSQVMNIPFLFMMLGLGENLMRRDGEPMSFN